MVFPMVFMGKSIPETTVFPMKIMGGFLLKFPSSQPNDCEVDVMFYGC